jgi:hypothetical protein
MADLLAKIKPSHLGDMYGQWALDAPIVEVAIAVAQDFVDRPSYFTKIPDLVAKKLEDLWYRMGSDPGFPDRLKRIAIYGAIFGACDSATLQSDQPAGQFQIARDAALDAAVRYTKRTFDEGRLSLRAAFHDRLITLREYLTTFDGAATDRSYGQTSSVFSTCTDVLKSTEVASAYGLAAAPNTPNWPRRGEYSGKGALLIEAIARTTAADQSVLITRPQVLAAQRVAFEGARVIDAALQGDLENDDLLEQIIARAFTWWTALQDAMPMASKPQSTRQVSSDASSPMLAVVPTSTKLIR